MASSRNASTDFGKGLARACAGAVIFGLPLLMTMEMWWLGFYMPSWKLALLLVLFLPILVVLSWHAGFEPTFRWRDDVVDAFVAYAVAFTSSAALLWLLGLLNDGVSAREAIGKIALQAVPAAIGALLAQSQLGERHATEANQSGPRYASELFIMGVGALFLSFNLAPTQEMVVIAERATAWQALLVALLSLGLMHAFVYGVAFRGGTGAHPDQPAMGLFFRFSVTGYALALLLSAGSLWFFGRLEGLAVSPAVQTIVVLAFPAAVGAAAARLIL